MSATKKLQILGGALLLLIAQAHCSQFMCYVCDDCNEVTANTPKLACDESFFIPVTTLPPTVTDDPTTETITETVSTTETTTTETTTPAPTASTEPTPPTPPTVGPPETTTGLPTPPNTGTLPSVAVGVNQPEFLQFNFTTTSTTTSETPTTTTTMRQEQGTTPTTSHITFLRPVNISMQPAELRIRQLRSVSTDMYSYHCYSVQQTVNGTAKTSRGCSRIEQNQAVCPQLEQANNNTKFTKCTPCTNTLCNASSSIGASAVAVALGILSAWLLRYSA